MFRRYKLTTKIQENLFKDSHVNVDNQNKR